MCRCYVEMFFDPARFPNGPSIRDLGPASDRRRSALCDEPLSAERGDANIKTSTISLAKSNFYQASGWLPGQEETLTSRNEARTLDVSARLDPRFAVQTDRHAVHERAEPRCADLPDEQHSGAEDRCAERAELERPAVERLVVLGQQGFPAITVPAGFTTQVYDRIPDRSASAAASQASNPDGGSAAPTELVGPVPARLPVGIDFLARPFGEPLLLRIAAAYEDATKHREVPAGFGALHGEH